MNAVMALEAFSKATALSSSVKPKSFRSDRPVVVLGIVILVVVVVEAVVARD